MELVCSCFKVGHLLWVCVPDAAVPKAPGEEPRLGQCQVKRQGQRRGCLELVPRDDEAGVAA